MSIVQMPMTDDANPINVRTVRFTNVNVQLVNGTGATETVNGRGNLVIGYNEFRGGANDDDRRGSHNLVIGKENNYTPKALGGQAVGSHNTIGGSFASVSGGSGNSATGMASSVGGGAGNSATGTASSVTGGMGNQANGDHASVCGGVSGGSGNTASSNCAAVSGGSGNTAGAPNSSVSGGFTNNATSDGSSISGGEGNIIGFRSGSISGGYQIGLAPRNTGILTVGKAPWAGGSAGDKLVLMMGSFRSF